MTDAPNKDSADKPRAGWAPSASTAGSGLGGSVAVIVLAILHQSFHITVDLETASAITVVCCTLAGYIPASGRTQVPPS